MMPTSNYSNNHKNGDHCPRCGIGYIYLESADIVCLMCGYRISHGIHTRQRLLDALLGRLIYNSSFELTDIAEKHWQMLDDGLRSPVFIY